MNVFQERGITHLDLHGVRHMDVTNLSIGFCFAISTRVTLNDNLWKQQSND